MAVWLSQRKGKGFIMSNEKLEIEKGYTDELKHNQSADGGLLKTKGFVSILWEGCSEGCGPVWAPSSPNAFDSIPAIPLVARFYLNIGAR
jgi:hypothetical protein